MDSIVISSSLTSPFTFQFPPPYKLLAFRRFTTKTCTKTRILSSKASKKGAKFFPLEGSLVKFSSPGVSVTSQCCLEEEKNVLEASEISKGKTESLISVTKTIVYVVFCIAISFSPVIASKLPAVAAPVVSEVKLKKKGRAKEKEGDRELVLKSKDHEYSAYTRSLLETVSSLLRTVDEVRKGNGDLNNVKSALQEVKVRKDKLQDDIMDGMYKELAEMKSQKEALLKRGEVIVGEILKIQRESEDVEGEAKEELLERNGRMDREYQDIWDTVGEVEDGILRRETVALSVGVRELCFIERECEELVKRFSQEMRRKNIER